MSTWSLGARGAQPTFGAHGKQTHALHCFAQSFLGPFDIHLAGSFPLFNGRQDIIHVLSWWVQDLPQEHDVVPKIVGVIMHTHDHLQHSRPDPREVFFKTSKPADPGGHE